MSSELELGANALKKLKSNSISVNMEDEGWSYAVKINVESGDIDIIRDEIIKRAYEEVDPSDATKVLMVLENV